MKQQTAVEFLMDKLFDASFDIERQIEWFEQAKEMEKKQIIDACESTDNTGFWVKYDSFEHYYNETFNKDE